ncbi:MAG: hypothetical protein HY320_06745 [Armatimonadetes bacterium]|nr:hypothetical protein [Armatimonadota bacterium]
MSSVTLVQNVLTRLEGVRRNGSGWMARCPAHDDGRASLSLGEGGDGRVLLKCFAGCETPAIVAALGLEMSDLFPPREAEAAAPRARIVTTYDYLDENRKLLFQVVRYAPKDFRQRRPDGNGDWTWKLDGVRRVLYRLPEVLKSVAEECTIYITEGERD